MADELDDRDEWSQPKPSCMICGDNELLDGAVRATDDFNGCIDGGLGWVCLHCCTSSAQLRLALLDDNDE